MRVFKFTVYSDKGDIVCEILEEAKDLYAFQELKNDIFEAIEEAHMIEVSHAKLLKWGWFTKPPKKRKSAIKS